MAACALLLLLWLLPLWAQAEPLCATDDNNAQLCLNQPAERIIAFSPGATELLFASGAGAQLVAVVAYSDYPEQAKKLPVVGDTWGLNLEQIMALRPDLMIAWPSGNGAGILRRLKQLGLKVFALEPPRLEDIPAAITRLGQLTGHQDQARQQAAELDRQIAKLRQQYSDQRPVVTFYQLSEKPLMTVGGRQLINQAIRLCGGRNAFAALKPMAPQVGLESVLAANPEAIISSQPGDEWRNYWLKLPSLTAVQRNNLFYIPADLIQRPTPRFLQGARLLCQQLQQARAKVH